MRYAIPSLKRELGLTTSAVGALNELRVAVDLIRRGFEVFRALDPSATVDLVVLRGTRAIRVEVRTAYERAGRVIGFAPAQPERFDVLAQVLTDRIVYTPPLTDVLTDAP